MPNASGMNKLRRQDLEAQNPRGLGFLNIGIVYYKILINFEPSFTKLPKNLPMGRVENDMELEVNLNLRRFWNRCLDGV